MSIDAPHSSGFREMQGNPNWAQYSESEWDAPLGGWTTTLALQPEGGCAGAVL